MISVDPAIRAALEGENLKIANLVALPLGLFFTNWHKDIAYGGDTFVSNGHLLKTGGVRRERGLKAHTHNIGLSGVDQTLLAAFSGTNIIGQEALVYEAYIDDAGAIISGAPMLIYKGTVDSWALSEGKNSTINIKLTNKWAAIEQVAGRRTSVDSQEGTHTGDKFFEMAHEEKSNLGWGSKE